MVARLVEASNLSDLRPIFVKPVVFVEAGVEIGAALHEGLGRGTVRDLEDHHHSRALAAPVAQLSDVFDVDVRLTEEIGRLLLDRLRDRFGAALQETHPGKQHRDSPSLAALKAQFRSAAQHKIWPSRWNGETS